MNTILPLGEVRPFDTAESRLSDFTPPLYRLRRHDRPVITPETCLVRNCPVCQWRREGLLDSPVVRETPSYGTVCSHCAYTLGREHGRADGPGHRPTRDWLSEAGLDPVAYLRGYDEGCHAHPCGAPLWNALDASRDGLPF